MLARIRKAREEREGGFTLIELLVVVIIIGILAAIAIPVFLNQRKKGVDAKMKSDARNAATAEETYLTDYNTYTNVLGNLNTEGFHASSNNTVTPSNNGSTTYCIGVDNSVEGNDGPYYFHSNSGSIDNTACSGGA